MLASRHISTMSLHESKDEVKCFPLPLRNLDIGFECTNASLIFELKGIILTHYLIQKVTVCSFRLHSLIAKLTKI